MTREEAKEVFINKGYVKVKGGIIFDGDKWRQSVEVITEWLKQQPCEDAISRPDAIRVASGYCHWSNIPKELAKLPSVNPIPCEDVISRQAAIDAMATWDWQELYLPIHFKQLLEDLPSVSTENTGRWKRVSIDKYIQHAMAYYKCSECGGQTIGQTEYCPNCGAKMEVEDG